MLHHDFQHFIKFLMTIIVFGSTGLGQKLPPLLALGDWFPIVFLKAVSLISSDSFMIFLLNVVIQTFSSYNFMYFLPLR